MIRTILFLILMQSLSVLADVTHHIQFCTGNFCAETTPLTITQQLELNQHFAEGNLLASPIKGLEINKSPLLHSRFRLDSVDLIEQNRRRSELH